MRSFILFLALLIFGIGSARAEDLLGVTAGSGSNIGGKLATGGGFHPGNMLCDASDPRICGPVSATAGPTVNPYVTGYNSGSSTVVTATPANASHAAGVSVGGLFTVPAARITGGSGIITTMMWISSGGATTQFQIRIWDKSPAATTCTDNSAYVGSEADDEHLLTQPFTFTPVGAVVATGDGKTYGVQQGLSLSFKNQDTSPTVNVYACVVTAATDTLDQNKPVYLILSGVRD